MNKHIQTCSRNTTYISWSAQIELIQAIGAVLTIRIVAEINEAKFFVLVADETIYCSGAEQLSVCLRFVKHGKIYERLLQLVEVTDLSGAGIASQLLNILRNVGINPHFMIGQSYDGASTMSGQHNGVQKHIEDQCPIALYTHCVSHRLQSSHC